MSSSLDAQTRFVGVRAAVAVAVVGIALSVGQAIVARRIEDGRINAHFSGMAANSAQNLNRTLLATLKSVEGVAALFGPGDRSHNLRSVCRTPARFRSDLVQPYLGAARAFGQARRI